MFFLKKVSYSFRYLQFVDVEINADEPDWVVNFKKGIVSQIQVDLTSVRPDGPAADLEAVFSEGHSATFNVFEVSTTLKLTSKFSLRTVLHRTR